MQDKIGKAKKVVITTLLENHSGSEPNLMAQHGISFLLEVTVDSTTKTILFDAGPSSETLIHNMKILNKNPSSIDMIALSHCHWDHTGGLVGMLKAIGRVDIPVLAHPSLFETHVVAGIGSKTRNWLTRPIGLIGENTEANIKQQGGFPTLVKNPFELMPGVLWAGEIERVTDFEMNPTLSTRIIKNGQIQKDPILDDTAIAINVADHGLVVVSGCSHSGIINIVKQCIKYSGVDTVKTVIGGFHLMSASVERIHDTIDALKKLKVEKIYSGHCTGFKAETMFSNEFNDAYEELHSGKVIHQSSETN